MRNLPEVQYSDLNHAMDGRFRIAAGRLLHTAPSQGAERVKGGQSITVDSMFCRVTTALTGSGEARPPGPRV